MARMTLAGVRTGLELDDLLERRPLLGRRLDQHGQHGRRAAHVSHPVLGDQAEHERRIDATQADV